MELTEKLFNTLKRLDKSGKLRIKVNAFIKGTEYFNNPQLFHKINTRKLSVKGIKLFADGSLGSRGAALLEPYSDDPTNYGIILYDFKTLYNSCRYALDRDYDIAVHSIGDAANRMTLSAFVKLCNDGYADNKYLRNEHCQLIKKEDLTFFEKHKNIIASIQPVHCISDAPQMVDSRLGKRSEYSYPWKSIKDTGTLLISGSDFPVISPDPLLGIHSLINRIPFNSNKPFYPEEILSFEDAVNTYTENPGIISRFKTKTGRIEVGYCADLVILNDTIENICSETKYDYNPERIEAVLIQ